MGSGELEADLDLEFDRDGFAFDDGGLEAELTRGFDCLGIEGEGGVVVFLVLVGFGDGLDDLGGAYGAVGLNPRFYIGSGKADEVAEAVRALEADLVLVDHVLTPVQERNLEKHLNTRVVDRAGLILDIFAQRARSHEGKLEVELAQLKHLATRLVRGWTISTPSAAARSATVARVKPSWKLIAACSPSASRCLASASRRSRSSATSSVVRACATPCPRVALVGYTNAGKSTLFNALTGPMA